MRINKTVVIVMALMILAPIVYSAVSPAFTSPPRPFLEMPDEKYEACIRDTDYMRLHHMDYLKEVREEYVRHGIRDQKGITSCRGCHASRERFCDRCHAIAELTIDCFDCHYYPEIAPVTSSNQGGE
jgi:hypothetical protein